MPLSYSWIGVGLSIGIGILVWVYMSKKKKAPKPKYNKMETKVEEKLKVITDKKEVRILSIDGGGIKGVIPTVILREIQRKTGKHPSELFDLVAGTSIGGIISLAMTTPNDEGCPLISTDKMLDIFIDHGRDIFRKSISKSLGNMGGLLDERYEADGLLSVLKKYMGDRKMNSSLVPVMVTSFELRRYTPYIFKSWDERNDFHRWFAGRATSAAPTYFELADGANHLGEPFSCIDGGVIMNNPAQCAYAEAKRLFPNAHTFTIVSIGCGEPKVVINPEEAKDWGIQWVKPLIDIMMDGNSKAIDQELTAILSEESYFRLQCPLPDNLKSMDNVSNENIQNLIQVSEEYVKQEQEKIDAICKFLLTPRKKK